MTDQSLIQSCLKNDRRAQKMLYDNFSAEMLKVCRHYTNSVQDAEDVFQNGFIQVFTNLDKYNHAYPLKPWMKRIFINCALKLHRSNKSVYAHEEAQLMNHESVINSDHIKMISDLSYEELLEKVRALPTGYRMVFMMYEIDGYKHAEIADVLGISVGTSKSQLLRAKKQLKKSIIVEREFNPTYKYG